MTELQRDRMVYEMAQTMTLREMDDEARSLAGRLLCPKELERVHLLESAKAQRQISGSRSG